MLSLREKFFKDITIGKNSTIKGINTYTRLIFNAQRHFISLGFPSYTKQTKSKNLDFFIKEYIKNSKPIMALPIYMMEDFINFIEINKLELRRFALDVLKFELTQIQIFNLPNEVRKNKFSWNKRYKLGINTKLIKSLYPIHLDDSKTKQQTYLMVYKELDYECYFIVITKFLYELLSMKNNKSILNNLKFMTTKHNIDFKETKKVIQNTLSNYSNQGILVTITN
jgi:hypothetical protein